MGDNKAEYIETRKRFAKMVTDYKEKLLFGEDISIIEIAEKYDLNKEPFLSDLQAVQDEFNGISAEVENDCKTEGKPQDLGNKTADKKKSIIAQLLNRKVLKIIRERDYKLRADYKQMEDAILLVASVAIDEKNAKGMDGEEEEEEEEEEQENTPQKGKSKGGHGL